MPFVPHSREEEGGAEEAQRAVLLIVQLELCSVAPCAVADVLGEL